MGEILDYAVRLEDQMSGPSKVASSGLENLTLSMLKAQKALGQVDPKPLDKVGQATNKAGKDTDSFLQKILKTEQVGLMRESFAAAAEGIKEFAGALKDGDVGGAVKGLGDALAGVAGLLDLVYPGLGQAASAVIKLTAGVAGLTAGLIQQGVALSISATQGKQAMISMFDALSDGTASGVQIEGMLSDLSDSIGITKDQLAPLTKEFLKMGIQGTASLEKMTKAAASAQAISAEVGDAFVSLQKKVQAAAELGKPFELTAKTMKALNAAGLSAADVAGELGVKASELEGKLKSGAITAKQFGDAMADAMNKKGASALDRAGMSLDNLKKMFSQSIGDLFEDMGDAIGPFLKEVKSLFSIFSQGTESGKAMKAGIGGAFTFIFAQLTKVIPPIKHFMLDVVIWSLKAYIFIKQHWSTISSVLKGVAIVLGIIGAALVITALIALAPLLILIATITAVVVTIGALIGAVMDLGPAAIKAAGDFIDGLVNGIKNGVGMVVDAAKNLGGAAIGAVKGVLGISSPSKIMMGVGMNTAEGMSGGIDAGAPDVASSAGAMGAGAAGAAQSGMTAADYKGGGKSADAGGSGGASGGGNTVTINLTAPGGVTNAMELTEIAVSALFERLALSQGRG